MGALAPTKSGTSGWLLSETYETEPARANLLAIEQQSSEDWKFQDTIASRRILKLANTKIPRWEWNKREWNEHLRVRLLFRSVEAIETIAVETRLLDIFLPRDGTSSNLGRRKEKSNEESLPSVFPGIDSPPHLLSNHLRPDVFRSTSPVSQINYCKRSLLRDTPRPALAFQFNFRLISSAGNERQITNLPREFMKLVVRTSRYSSHIEQILNSNEDRGYWKMYFELVRVYLKTSQCWLGGTGFV